MRNSDLHSSCTASAQKPAQKPFRLAAETVVDAVVCGECRCMSSVRRLT